MTKPIMTAAALVIALSGCVLTSLPAQAASRLMMSSPEGFQYRCENHGGQYGNDGFVVTCHTPSVLVSCEYFLARQASCQWPGIERQIDVSRVIGSLPENIDVAYSDDSDDNQNISNGGGNVGGGAGGLQGPPDLQEAPGNNPTPGFDGPPNFQIAPGNNPKPGFDGPPNFQLAP